VSEVGDSLLENSLHDVLLSAQICIGGHSFHLQTQLLLGVLLKLFAGVSLSHDNMLLDYGLAFKGIARCLRVLILPLIVLISINFIFVETLQIIIKGRHVVPLRIILATSFILAILIKMEPKWVIECPCITNQVEVIIIVGTILWVLRLARRFLH